MKPFSYAESRPLDAHAEHLLSYWSFEARLPDEAPRMHHLWPDGCVSVAVIMHPGAPSLAMIVGPAVGPRQVPVRNGARYRGIRFWPDTGASVLGVAAAVLRDRVMLASLVFGDDETNRLIASVERRTDAPEAWRAIDDWIAPRIAASGQPDSVVRRGSVR